MPAPTPSWGLIILGSRMVVPESSSLKGKTLLTAPRDPGNAALVEGEGGVLRQCRRLQQVKVCWQTPSGI